MTNDNEFYLKIETNIFKKLYVTLNLFKTKLKINFYLYSIIVTYYTNL